MDYIHDQLTQLLQNENTLFKFFLVFFIMVAYLLLQINQETTIKGPVM